MITKAIMISRQFHALHAYTDHPFCTKAIMISRQFHALHAYTDHPF
jgi:hypothetical protein